MMRCEECLGTCAVACPDCDGYGGFDEEGNPSMYREAGDCEACGGTQEVECENCDGIGYFE